jgi:hypothetical protein
MLLSLFSFVALAALIAAISVPQDATENIACTTLPGISGTLMLQHLPPPQPPPPPVQLGLVDHMLGQGGANQQFSFQNCTSTYMNQTQFQGSNYVAYYGWESRICSS